jgi:hypothetical protein
MPIIGYPPKKVRENAYPRKLLIYLTHCAEWREVRVPHRPLSNDGYSPVARPTVPRNPIGLRFRLPESTRRFACPSGCLTAGTVRWLTP